MWINIIYCHNTKCPQGVFRCTHMSRCHENLSITVDQEVEPLVFGTENPSHKTNVQTKGCLTHKKWMFKCFCENERCMGKPRSTLSHKTNEHTRGRLTHNKWMFECLCEKGRSMSKSRNRSPSHKTTEHMRGRHTHKKWTFEHLSEKGRSRGKLELLPKMQDKWAHERKAYTKHMDNIS